MTMRNKEQWVDYIRCHHLTIDDVAHMLAIRDEKIAQQEEVIKGGVRTDQAARRTPPLPGFNTAGAIRE